MRTRGLCRSVTQKVLLGAETFETVAGPCELVHEWTNQFGCGHEYATRPHRSRMFQPEGDNRAAHLHHGLATADDGADRLPRSLNLK